MASNIPEGLKIKPGLVFFLITSIQIGVGILTFQNVIVRKAGYDGWISIIIAGIGIHIILWMIFKIYMKEKKDIFDIHRTYFGKWIGGFLSLLLIFYYMLLTVVILRYYIEVIQVWMFPAINVFAFGLIFIILVYYVVNGGFRAVAGISFLGFLIPMYLILTLLFPLKFAHYENLLPIFNHSVTDIFKASKDITLSVLGISTILVYFPFIEQPERSHKWAQFGVVYTILIYLAAAFVAFVFYDEEQIKTVIWPTIGFWKIIEMPVVERFEYIGISSWALVILPNLAITTWAVSRGAKRLFGMKQRKALVIILGLVLVAVLNLKGHNRIHEFGSYINDVGFFLLYGYIPLLFLFILIVHKVRKTK